MCTSRRTGRILWPFVLALAPAYMASADLAQDVQGLEDDINELIGIEYAGVEAYFNLATIGVEITATMEGLGFCEPPDPTAQPNSNPTPPNNAYRCVNGASVAASEIPTTTTASVTVTMSELFVDYSTERGTSVFCSEGAGETVTEEGYFLADAVFEFTVDIEVVPECTIYTFVDDSSSLTIGSYDFFTNDECLQTYAAIAGGLLVGSVEQQLEIFFTDAIIEYLDERNLQACQGTPVLPSSWARVKARY